MEISLYFGSLLLSKYFDNKLNLREYVKEMSIFPCMKHSGKYLSDQMQLHLSLLFCSCKVLEENQIPGDLQLVEALAAVLTASQRFMRDQTVV